MASIEPGVLPNIALASVPTATTVLDGLPFSFLRATTDGSFKTTPLPLAYTRVLAVPRSIDRSLEKYPIISQVVIVFFWFSIAYLIYKVAIVT